MRDANHKAYQNLNGMGVDTMDFKDMNGMNKHQKIMEQHKRAARRNFLIGSRDEKDKIKERYKPANLRGILKLKGDLMEKS